MASAILEGDLYAAAPLDTDGSSLQFRRKAGRRANVWMYDSWVSGKSCLTQPCPSTHIKTVNIRVVISIKSFSLLSEKELLLPKLSESHQKEQHKVHCADTHCIPPREACCAVTDQD